MTANVAFLNDRAILSVAGEDAGEFLQNLLTNDVAALAKGEARYAGLLTPQGKILFDFFVVRTSDDPTVLLLDCPAALSGDLVRRLTMYRLRARLTIVDRSAELGVVADWGAGQGAPGGYAYVDPRAASLGRRVILPRAQADEFGEDGLGAYEARRIGLGVPKGGVDFPYGDAFPHDADMDLFNGVDFAKGCYVGQEVVSRMKHRGEARKRVVRVHLAGPAPAPGAPVTDGALTIGALGAAAGFEALALLRLDRVAEARAAGRPLVAGAIGLSVDEAAASQ